jgi:hypothetical protein
MVSDENSIKELSGKGKIKGTSAFNIKEANNIKEISWSNNKFESTYSLKEESNIDKEE